MVGFALSVSNSHVLDLFVVPDSVVGDSSSAAVTNRVCRSGNSDNGFASLVDHSVCKGFEIFVPRRGVSRSRGLVCLKLIHPGDVISTGTPGAVPISDGDVVT